MHSIEIIGLNGHRLVLPQDVVMPYNSITGWETADINYDIIYPFTIPLRANQKALGIITDDSLPINYKDIEGFFDDGFTLRKCIISIQNANEFEDQVEISVMLNGIEISQLQENLREIPMPVGGVLSVQYGSGISNVWPNTPMYFPLIRNPRFYDDPATEEDNRKNPTYLGYVNAIDFGTGTLLQNFENFQTGEMINRNTAAPCVAIKEVVKRCFDLSGYNVDGTWWRDASMNRLFTYNNNGLDTSDVLPWEDAKAFNAVEFFLYRNFRFESGGKTFVLIDEKMTHPLEFTSTNQVSVFNVTPGSVTVASVGGVGVYDVTVKVRIFGISSNQGRPNDYFVIRPVLVDTNLNFQTTQLTAINLTQSPNGDLFEVSGQFTRLNSSSTNANYRVEFHIELIGQSRTNPSISLRFQVEEFHMKRVLETPLIRFRNVTNLADHLPDMSFADLLNELITQFTLRWRVDDVDKIFYLDYAIPELNAPAKPVHCTALRTGRVINWDPIRKIAIRYAENDDDRLAGAEFESMFRIFPVIENGVLSFRNNLVEDNYDQIIELKTHPIPREFSWQPSSEIYEEGISEPLNIKGSLSPLRLGFYVGMVSGIPRADSGIEGISFYPNTQGNSFLRLLANFITRMKSDPRIYRQPVTFKYGEFKRFDPSQVIEIDGNRYICISIDSERKLSHTIEAVLTLRRI
jgi:hypothetical protein